MIAREIPFREDVARTRVSFLRDLDQIPQPFSGIAENYVLTRISQSRSKLMLGEYAPWLLADLCGFDQQDRLEEFILAWLHVYVYTLIVDDILDNQRRPSHPLELVAGSLLLERGLQRLHELDSKNSPKTFLSHFQHDLDDLAIATFREFENRKRSPDDIEWKEISVDADKVRILNVCIDYFRAHGCSNPSAVHGWKSMRPLFEALQLLDDITDFEEDWKNGHWTLPIALAISRLRLTKDSTKNVLAAMDDNGRLFSLIASGALVECLALVQFSIRSVVDAFSLTVESDAITFLRGIDNRCSEFRRTVDSFVQSTGELNTEFVLVPAYFESNLEIREKIEIIRQQFILIAQES